MAWRSQGITGSNNVPLGSRRRFGGEDGPVPEQKRGRSPERGKSPYHATRKIQLMLILAS
jgi:splicing factor 1